MLKNKLSFRARQFHLDVHILSIVVKLSSNYMQEPVVIDNEQIHLQLIIVFFFVIGRTKRSTTCDTSNHLILDMPIPTRRAATVKP